MKILLIALFGLLAVCGSISARSLENISQLETVEYQQRIFEGRINDSVNDAVAKLKEHDPVIVTHLQKEVAGYSVLIENAKLEGFSNIVASKISLGGFITWTLDMIIDIRTISGSIGKWKIDGDKSYGDGDAKFNMDNAKLTIVVTLNPISMSVKSAKITPRINNAQVSITGILNDEELSRKVSEKIAWVLNDYINNDKDFQKKLNQAFYDFLKKVIG